MVASVIHSDIRTVWFGVTRDLEARKLSKPNDCDLFDTAMQCYIIQIHDYKQFIYKYLAKIPLFTRLSERLGPKLSVLRSGIVRAPTIAAF